MHEPVLVMNVDGILYPVGMTEEQLTVFKVLVSSISKEKPLNVLKKAPIATALEVVDKVNEKYNFSEI